MFYRLVKELAEKENATEKLKALFNSKNKRAFLFPSVIGFGL